MLAPVSAATTVPTSSTPATTQTLPMRSATLGFSGPRWLIVGGAAVLGWILLGPLGAGALGVGAYLLTR